MYRGSVAFPRGSDSQDETVLDEAASLSPAPDPDPDPTPLSFSLSLSSPPNPDLILLTLTHIGGGLALTADRFLDACGLGSNQGEGHDYG